MRRKILIGSILTVFVLMMMPSISAVQYTTVAESNTSQIIEQIRDMDIDELREKINDKGIDKILKKIQGELPGDFPKMSFFINLILSFRFYQVIIIEALLMVFFSHDPWSGFTSIIPDLILMFFILRLYAWDYFWDFLGFDVTLLF